MFIGSFVYIYINIYKYTEAQSVSNDLLCVFFFYFILNMSRALGHRPWKPPGIVAKCYVAKSGKQHVPMDYPER